MIKLTLFFIFITQASIQAYGQSADSLQVSRQSEGKFVIIDDQWINQEHLFPGGNTSLKGTRPSKVVTWPEGVLPIVFNKDIPASVRDTFWRACAEWSSVAQVRCHNGVYKNRRLTVSRTFMGQGGCWSMLGSDYYFLMLRRRMNLGQGCESYDTILHELGHAFGLTHEHQRADRDQYIEIVEENVEKGFLGFGRKLNFDDQKGEQLSPYDFLSIMHYSRYSFSKNGKETIRVKEPYTIYADRIGHAEHLSAGDIMSIQKLYGSK